jgi:uncharacterized protein YabN with tetrapyrrole methylase and pyrophosphatase domain
MSSHFDKLMELNKDLLGKCNWVKSKSVDELKNFIVEEANEVSEAVDKKDFENLKEELGDLIFVALLLAQRKESEGKFTVHDVLEEVNQKIIRRNPHVFGDKVITDIEEIEKEWNKIKAMEKSKQ